MNIKFGGTTAVALAMMTAPAHAISLSDLAKVVLGNGATVQRAAENCPNKVTLAPAETLALSLARQAAQNALPGAQFLMLDTAANSQAVTASQAPNFCNRTAKRKNVMIDAVKKAGQKLITARVLGL